MTDAALGCRGSLCNACRAPTKIMAHGLCNTQCLQDRTHGLMAGFIGGVLHSDTWAPKIRRLKVKHCGRSLGFHGASRPMNKARNSRRQVAESLRHGRHFALTYRGREGTNSWIAGSASVARPLTVVVPRLIETVIDSMRNFERGRGTSVGRDMSWRPEQTQPRRVTGTLKAASLIGYGSIPSSYL